MVYTYCESLGMCIEDADSKTLQCYSEKAQRNSDIIISKWLMGSLACDQLHNTKRRLVRFAKTQIIKLSSSSSRCSGGQLSEADAEWDTHKAICELVGIGSFQVTLPFVVPDDIRVKFLSRGHSVLEDVNTLLSHLDHVIIEEQRKENDLDPHHIRHNHSHLHEFFGKASAFSVSVLFKLHKYHEKLQHSVLFYPLMAKALKTILRVLEMDYFQESLMNSEYSDLITSAEELAAILCISTMGDLCRNRCRDAYPNQSMAKANNTFIHTVSYMGSDFVADLTSLSFHFVTLSSDYEKNSFVFSSGSPAAWSKDITSALLSSSSSSFATPISARVGTGPPNPMSRTGKEETGAGAGAGLGSPRPRITLKCETWVQMLVQLMEFASITLRKCVLFCGEKGVVAFCISDKETKAKVLNELTHVMGTITLLYNCGISTIAQLDMIEVYLEEFSYPFYRSNYFHIMWMRAIVSAMVFMYISCESSPSTEDRELIRQKLESILKHRQDYLRDVLIVHCHSPGLVYIGLLLVRLIISFQFKSTMEMEDFLTREMYGVNEDGEITLPEDTDDENDDCLSEDERKFKHTFKGDQEQIHEEMNVWREKIESKYFHPSETPLTTFDGNGHIVNTFPELLVVIANVNIKSAEVFEQVCLLVRQV